LVGVFLILVGDGLCYFWGIYSGYICFMLWWFEVVWFRDDEGFWFSCVGEGLVEWYFVL